MVDVIVFTEFLHYLNNKSLILSSFVCVCFYFVSFDRVYFIIVLRAVE
jgi:hypothetical protein